jgi:hypothetical protein
MAGQNVPPHDERPYGFMERELAFKLLAAHGLVDHEFFEHLRRDPEAAAAELHIRLTSDDIDYLRNSVDWEHLARNAPHIRTALNLELVTNSW